MSFLTQEEIEQIGLRQVGVNVKISNHALFFNPKNISIGNNCRIDAFSILSAGDKGIFIGDYVHIAINCSLQGSELIEIKNFAGISSRTAIYSSTDDFSGIWLTGPCIPNEYRKVFSKAVIIGEHVIIGTGATILPGVIIEKGAAVGAMSLVTKNIPESEIHSGIPARFYKKRSTKLFDLEKFLLKSNG